MLSKFAVMLFGVSLNEAMFNEDFKGLIGLRLLTNKMLKNIAGCYKEYPLQGEFTRLLQGKKFV